MDENPYKAPDGKISSDREKHSGRHPMLDPFWQRAAWIILTLPLLIGLLIHLVLSALR